MASTLILPIAKPDTTSILTQIFGIPKGTIGRNGFDVCGIILHCLGANINTYNNYMKCSTKQDFRTIKGHPSVHYGIGHNGNVFQYVMDGNVSWGFQEYNDPNYPTPPTPEKPISWEPLNTEKGGVTPDLYVINIGMENQAPSTSSGCVNCPTGTVLADQGYDSLIQLLAYLAETYSVPIDTGHIQFHETIQNCEAGECMGCKDIDKILVDVINYCQDCEEEAPDLDIVELDQVSHLRAKTDPVCCTDNGCDVYVPFDNCLIGNIAATGPLTDGILGVSLNIDGNLCMEYGCLSVTSPITGCGTASDPLMLSLSVIDTNCIDLALDLDMGTITADIILSPDDGNGLECLANGLYVNNDVICLQAQANGIANIIANPGTIVDGVVAGSEITLTLMNISLINNACVTVTWSGLQWFAIHLGGVDTLAEVNMGYEISTDGGMNWIQLTQAEAQITLQNDIRQNVQLQMYQVNVNIPPVSSIDYRMRAVVTDIVGAGRIDFNGIIGYDPYSITAHGTTIVN